MFKVRIFVLLAVFGLISAFFVNCYAQDMDTSNNEETFAVGGASAVEEMSIPESEPATQESPGAETGIGTLEGIIRAVDREQMTFKMSYPITFVFKELSFTIMPMTEIIKNMNDADFFDIQVGDRAIVDYIDDSSDPLKAMRVTLVGGYEE
ncbi:MAG: hypothetical protein ABIC68_05620 [Candidatus Omnitrophota bacterium]